jgi:hypothetical protein
MFFFLQYTHMCALQCFFHFLQAQHKQLVSNFKELDTRINSIGNSAIQIGDRLESLDAQKRRAQDAEQLIRTFLELNSGVERRDRLLEPSQLEQVYYRAVCLVTSHFIYAYSRYC